MKPGDCILFSGAAQGAEAAFGAAAERYGIEEVNFTFEGHNDARTRGIRVLTQRGAQARRREPRLREPADAPALSATRRSSGRCCRASGTR